MRRWSERAKGFALGVFLYASLVSVSVALAAWTTPRTWTTAELVTASLFNTHLRDNLDYIKSHLDTAETTLSTYRFPAVLMYSGTAQANTTTVSETLYLGTVGAGKLATNGDALRVTVLFKGANNADEKLIAVGFGSTTIAPATSPALYYQDSYVKVVAELTRLGATSQRWTIWTSAGTGNAGTSTETLANAQLIVFNVDCTNAADITGYSFLVQFIPKQS